MIDGAIKDTKFQCVGPAPMRIDDVVLEQSGLMRRMPWITA